MSAAYEWIESGGGPLLFAPQSALSRWHGNKLPTGRVGPTDYARACAVKDEIGVVIVGESQALVLGDEPDRTSLVASLSSSDVTICRWRWADSEASLLAALGTARLGQLPFTPTGQFDAIGGVYHLFDSAYSGDEIPRSLRVTLKLQTYSFDSIEFRPNERTCALIHRIRAVA